MPPGKYLRATSETGNANRNARPFDALAAGVTMIRSSFAAIALLALTASNLDAVDRQAVTTVRPLLVTAIDQGEAHGVLVGQAAQTIAQAFKSTAPIEIDVKTVQALGEPGCKRLAVTTSQDGVLDFNREQRETQSGRKAFTYQFNYCRDGRTPQTNEASR
jgi:hypothetical protein